MKLARHLRVDHKITYQAYDPHVARYAKEPVPAQFVVSLNSVEYSLPEDLDDKLDHIQRLCEGIVLFAISTQPPPGAIAKPMSWWADKFWPRWDVQTLQMVGETEFVMVGYTNFALENAAGEKIGAA